MRKTRYACAILGEEFATAESLRDRCRMILDKYLGPHCAAEQQMEEEDAAFFVELVRLRDKYRISSGVYVSSVLRSSRLGHIGRHVVFVYSDGTRDMISWKKLCGGPPSSKQRVTNAMRESVRAQMISAWGSHFRGASIAKCTKTGAIVTAGEEWHGEPASIHHDGVPFAQIRDEWLSENGLSFEDVPLKDLFDGGGHEVAPGDLADSWKSFHASRANLIVVSAEWHKLHHGEKLQEESAK